MKKLTALLKFLVKFSLTIAILGSAAYFGYHKYKEYFDNPWTRDGQVRTQVIQVAARVSGMVTKIHIIDNQAVKTGDLLFEIDPEPYQIKVDQAEAGLRRSKESAKGRKVEFERVKKIYAKDAGAVSQKDMVQNEVSYYKALAGIDSSKESLNTAKVNLKFTKIYAEVDGYVSNINFQIGTQAVANQPILALVDTSSYWVFGYFRENTIGDVKIGDDAKVTLMAYPDRPLSGKVESIAWGIANSDGNPGENLLPSVQPVFQWIRLAQRIPVRIKLDPLPENVELRFGLTASVMVLKNSGRK
jgi:multidrug resistance efflux pump